MLTKEQIIDTAIEHEKTCECEMHQKHPRLSTGDLKNLRRIYLDPGGQAFIMALASITCAEDMDACTAFNKLYHEIMQVKLRNQ